MQPLKIKDLRKGDFLKIAPNCPEDKKAHILRALGLKGTKKDYILEFAGVYIRNKEHITVKYNGKIAEGWFPHRFVLVESKTKEQQLLEKIQQLWERQEYVRSKNATI